jgi:hypothetical protein
VTFLHRFRKDDDGWYECVYCHRVSKDTNILNALPCVDGFAIDHSSLPTNLSDRSSWTTTSITATRAVTDSTMEKSEPQPLERAMTADLQEELGKLAEKRALYITSYRPISMTPMTTMPGFTVFGMSADCIEMVPLVFTRTFSDSEASKFLNEPRYQSGDRFAPHPMTKAFYETIAAETERLNVHLVRTNYEVIERTEHKQRWQATAWVRPSNASPQSKSPVT